MSLYYKQPKYYDKFKCIGGACPVTCCGYWRIDWLQEEIERLKEKDCSEELKSLIDTSFEEIENAPVDNLHAIRLNEDCKCPLQDADGLCRVQKELGEEYLSRTCAVYPRKFFWHRDAFIRSCHSSCPAVLDLLSEDVNALRFENRKTEKELKMRTSTGRDSSEMIKNNPELGYRIQLMEFYNSIITCRGVSLETAVVLGALASKHFADAVGHGKYDEIPKIIAEYEKKLHDRSVISAIEEIKPNPAVQFKFVNNLLLTYFEGSNIHINISNLHDGEKVIPERYNEGKKILEEAFSGKEYFFKNLAANMLLEQRVPFYIKDVSILENYSYFALTVAATKLISISAALNAENVERDVKCKIAVLSRVMAHNASKAKDIVEDMKKHGFTSAAHIALFIK
mgnify:FL=1